MIRIKFEIKGIQHYQGDMHPEDYIGLLKERIAGAWDVDEDAVTILEID